MKTALLTLACSTLLVTTVVGQDRRNSAAIDRKLEKKIAGLGRAYTDMIKRSDAAAIEKILDDDYLVADEAGKVFTKADDLATYPDRARSVKIESAEYLDQRVRIINHTVAIDHATIRFLGTRSGKRFDITERCTTVWALRKGRWRIVADHFSYVKP